MRVAPLCICRIVHFHFSVSACSSILLSSVESWMLQSIFKYPGAGSSPRAAFYCSDPHTDFKSSVTNFNLCKELGHCSYRCIYPWFGKDANRCLCILFHFCKFDFEDFPTDSYNTVTARYVQKNQNASVSWATGLCRRRFSKAPVVETSLRTYASNQTSIAAVVLKWNVSMLLKIDNYRNSSSFAFRTWAFFWSSCFSVMKPNVKSRLP